MRVRKTGNSLPSRLSSRKMPPKKAAEKGGAQADPSQCFRIPRWTFDEEGAPRVTPPRGLLPAPPLSAAERNAVERVLHWPRLWEEQEGDAFPEGYSDTEETTRRSLGHYGWEDAVWLPIDEASKQIYGEGAEPKVRRTRALG